MTATSPFLWGTATSAHQVEGNNRHNDWWAFESRFARSGRAADFVHRFEDDLDRCVELGTNAFRFSIEWSRIEPQGGHRDPAAIDYYDRLINGCLARGLTPIVTLVHFTLPAWCPHQRWRSPTTREAFARHVAWLCERYGDRVHEWVTFNEPNVAAGAGYLAGVFPPGRRMRVRLADRALRGILDAHIQAYDTIHQSARTLRRATPRVGVSPHLVDWQPPRWSGLGLARRTCDRFNWAFLDAIGTGVLNLDTLRARVPQARDTLDFIGVNYFMSMPASWLGILRFAGALSKPVTARTSDLGWPVDPGGFERVLQATHARYPSRPIMVTENGIADRDDRMRPDYLRNHVAVVQKLVAEGMPIRGYCHWSIVDNFEWHEGFAGRFGLYAVNYETMERLPRPSALLYRTLIAEARATRADSSFASKPSTTAPQPFVHRGRRDHG